MSEELKPCPFCGNSAILHSRVYPDERQIFYVQCDTFKPGWCGAMVSEKPEGGGLFHERGEAIDAWNRRAPMTAPAPAGEEGEALIEWLTGLVNEGGDAPIEIPVRDMKLLLSLLSSPRVERARALEEAAKVAEDIQEQWRGGNHGDSYWTADTIVKAIRSLSPTDKQARG